MPQETSIVQEFKQSRAPLAGTEASEAPASKIGPGARLRLARLEMDKVSIEDIAAHLRLSPQVILDIENDEYTNTLFTFTRGYLRGYAKLMGLPEEEIIQSFNELHLTESPRPYLPFDDASKKPLKVKDGASRSHEKAVRWISASVIVLSLVLVGFWWENQSTTIIPLQHSATHSSKLAPLLSSASPEPTTVPVNPTNLAQNNVTQPSASDVQVAVGTTEASPAPAVSDEAPGAVPANTQAGTSAGPATTSTIADASTTANPAVPTVPVAKTPGTEATTPSSSVSTDSKTDVTKTDQAQPASASVPKTHHHAAKKPKPAASSSQSMNTIVPVPYSSDDE